MITLLKDMRSLSIYWDYEHSRYYKRRIEESSNCDF
jgi:hypothetical protein